MHYSMPGLPVPHHFPEFALSYDKLFLLALLLMRTSSFENLWLGLLVLKRVWAMPYDAKTHLSIQSVW